MQNELNDHLTIGAAESAAVAPAEWEAWIDAVEALIGHSADGDLHADGYSMDTFHDMFKAGLTAEAASTRIVRSVFLAPDGTVYRLGEARQDRLQDTYRERYSALTVDGYQSARYELPADAVLVWTPDRGMVTSAGEGS